MDFRQKLRQQLAGRLTDTELELLPAGYQIVGKLLLLRLKPGLLKRRKLIGAVVHSLRPYVHAVFLIKGISDIERRPKLELLSARPGPHPVPLSQTVHSEHGCRFLLDLSQVMWAAGNKGEKLRLLKQVRSGEVIVDMFAGVGYFSIVLAKHSKAKKIYCIEINPKAAAFLEKNTIMNGVDDKIEIIISDCRKVAKFLSKVADRVIMGYLIETQKYLPAAFGMLKDYGTIHYHTITDEKGFAKLDNFLAKLATKNGFRLNLPLNKKRVKSYAPHLFHVVADMYLSREKLKSDT